jgi:sugar O-acyltransferase (sialic acid O-acetyltransferase NeuD family)
VQFVICAGSGAARRRIADRLASGGIRSGRYATVVHPSAVVSDSCVIGPGSVLLAQVSMTADVTLGEHVVVMPQVVMTHDVVVSDFTTLCAGVALGGNVHVESGAYLGMNSSVRQGLRVGRDATLGMGSVLLRNLPAEQTWVGVPAKSVEARSADSTAQVHHMQGLKSVYSVTERYGAR